MMCSFGEPLTVWSWLQLSGFVILSIGILMFNGTIKCCQDKPEENKETLVYCCLLKSVEFDVHCMCSYSFEIHSGILSIG